MTRSRAAAVSWIFVSGATTLAAATWLAAVAHAEEGPSSPFSAEERRYVGAYKYGKSLDHGRAIVRGAMGKAIDQMSPILRPLARSKLASSDPLIHRIVIALPEGRISVTLVGVKRATFATRPGVREKVRNPQGKQVDLTQRFVKGRLEQVFVGPKGRSRTLYALSADAKGLSVQTTMTGKELDTPISYRLEYVRE